MRMAGNQLWRKLPLCSLYWLVCCLATTLTIADDAGSELNIPPHFSPYELTSLISINMLENRINEVKNNPALDPETLNTLLDSYRQTITNLRAYNANVSAIEHYAESIDVVAAEKIRLTQELEDAQQQPVPALAFDDTATGHVLGRELLKAMAEESAQEAKLSRMRMRQAAEQQRLTLNRQMLTDAVQQQAKAIGEGEGVSLVGESLQLKRARQWVRESNNLVLSTEITRLDQELLSYSVRASMKSTLAKLASTQLSKTQQRLAAIKPLWLDKRRKELSTLVVTAEHALAQRENAHPLLLRVATNNTRISQQLSNFVPLIETILHETSVIAQQALALEEKYRLVQQKLQVAGIDKALGRVLEDERQRLPSEQVLRDKLNVKLDHFSDITIQKLQVEEDLLDLSNRQTYIDQLLAVTGIDADTQLNDELGPLLDQRVILYKRFQNESIVYQQLLADHEYTQQRLLNNVTKYDALLAERSLWVRSAANPEIQTVVKLTGEQRQYFSSKELKSMLRSLSERDDFTPILIVGMLISLLLVIRRPALIRRLARCNRHLGNPLRDRFRFTFNALVITILLALPGPLLLSLIGWNFYFDIYDSGLAKALGPALRWTSVYWFAIGFFCELCRPNGLAQCHLDWPAASLAPMRHNARVLMLCFIPLSFVNACLITLAAEGPQAEWIHIGQMLEALVATLFFLFMLRRSGAVMQGLGESGSSVMLLKFRWLWIALLVSTPLVLLVLNGMGYTHTAITLFNNYLHSVGMVLILAVGHQLGMRWVRVTATALNFRTHGQAGNNSKHTEEGKPYRPPELDLAELGRDSVQLLNTLTFAIGALGFMLVWLQALPALGMMDNIELWSVTRVRNGEPVAEAVTLADISLGLMIIVAAALIYRNLPSLLKLFLLQDIPLSESVRYTTINLTLYVLVISSVFTVANILGFEWSKFQWLVAALGVGIGFGLQEIVANLISGMVILIERPIRVGDLVTVGNIEGFVSRIRIRATTIMTYDRQELLVPNKDFITGTLLNWSLSDPISRLTVDVGVAYSTDVTEASRIIAGVAVADHQVIADPKPIVIFERFGDNALILRLQCFIDDPEQRIPTLSRLHHGINERFKAEGIAIAYPQLDVHINAQ